MFAGGTPSGWHCASAPRIVARRYTVALASPPDISSCACELGTLSIGAPCECEKLAVIHSGLIMIARDLCGARCPMVSAEAVRLALLRCFILFERENWLAGLVQQDTGEKPARKTKIR